MPQYTKPERILLKAHSEYTEKWIQDRIAEEPEILGLGELVFAIESESSRERAVLICYFKIPRPTEGMR